MNLARLFGRKYGNGLVEKFHCDDAEVVLVTMGSMSGNAKIAVEELRAEGKARRSGKDSFLQAFSQG